MILAAALVVATAKSAAAAKYAGYYTVSLVASGAVVGEPCGSGYVTLTLDAKGKVKMHSESPDATYTALLANLRAAMKNLAKRIEPKVYEYGFLKR